MGGASHGGHAASGGRDADVLLLVVEVLSVRDGHRGGVVGERSHAGEDGGHCYMEVREATESGVIAADSVRF